MECSVAAGNSAHRQRRGGVTSLGDFFGVSGCVPDYWCNVSESLRVLLFWRPRGEVWPYFPRLKYRSIRVMRSELGV